MAADNRSREIRMRRSLAAILGSLARSETCGMLVSRFIRRSPQKIVAEGFLWGAFHGFVETG